MYFILNFIGPKYIISQNWVSIRESLYCVWTKNHKNSKFIVIQHGAYVGGAITDIAHRYTKCDIFWVWGDYFLETFRRFNKGKSVQILSLGNPIYNKHDRDKYNYKESEIKNILISPSVFDIEGLQALVRLVKQLSLLDFKVNIKLHALQFKINNGLTENIVEEQLSKYIIDGNLYAFLEYQKFDLVVSDHSTVILDASFFKNKVLYFDAFNNAREEQTIYSKYLTNLYGEMNSLVCADQIIELISIENQERLYTRMISKGSNSINFL